MTKSIRDELKIDAFGTYINLVPSNIYNNISRNFKNFDTLFYCSFKYLSFVLITCLLLETLF